MHPKDIQDKYQDLQFIPINSEKIPIAEGWQKTKKKYEFFEGNGIGIVCGALSGGVEAIDFDLKYDLTGDLFDRFKLAVKEVNKDLLPKMVVQKTKSNGYHFIYRCSEIDGNKKLARRKATEEESISGNKVKVLIETRGEGGYIACWPTPGYHLIHGTYDKINTITPEERDVLFSIAREFNLYIEEFKPRIVRDQKKLDGLSPWEDYDNRGDVIRLLESHGWKVKGEKGNKTLLLRPGDSKARYSGNYDSSLNYFSVFSTSTEFEPEKGYKPSAVFATLECKGDFSESAKKLYDLGYGARFEKQSDRSIPNHDSYEEPKKNKVKGKDVKRLGQFLDQMVYEFDNGKPRGEDLRIEVLRPIFSWLKTEVTVVTGFPNHGKSELTLFLMMVKSVVDGWRWAIFCPENMPPNMFFDSLINTYVGKSVDKKHTVHMSKEEYVKAAKFIEQHFILIEPEEDSSLENILDNFEYLIKTERIDGVMIDPWNQIQHEITQREDQYLSNKLSKIKTFTKLHKIIFLIIAHPKTMVKLKDGTYPPPDDKSISGGIIWPAKVDNILVVHRPYYHTDSKLTEVDVISKKIKKQKIVGIPGTVRLKYNRVKNRYTDVKDTDLFPITVNGLQKEDEKSVNYFPPVDTSQWEALPKYDQTEDKDEIIPF